MPLLNAGYHVTPLSKVAACGYRWDYNPNPIRKMEVTYNHVQTSDLS